MIISNYFSNKTFLILGMGKTGTALSKALYKSHANVSFWDDDPQIRKNSLNQVLKIFKYKKTMGSNRLYYSKSWNQHFWKFSTQTYISFKKI